MKRARPSVGEANFAVSQICRFVNNQLKLKVIAIDTKYKTKPVIIKGKYWRVL